MEYQLRFATESDRSFLYQLHCSTMRSHIEKTWGWDDAWQRRDFDRRFREQQVSVIEVDGRDAGGLWLELRADALHLADLQISADLQRQGIGTSVLRGVIAQAAGGGLPVSLAVLPSNEGAKRLYERLGFEVTTVEVPFVHMCYKTRTMRAV